jgi:hypothetical protein
MGGGQAFVRIVEKRKKSTMANKTSKTEAGAVDPTKTGAAPDPWGDSMGDIPAELLKDYTEKDTQAGSTFAPYWTPEKGRRFFGEVVESDYKNPAFVRYTLLSAMPKIVCHRGEKESQEEIVVGMGERFSVSAYFSLPLEEYIGLGPVLVTVTDKTKLANGNTMWIWDVKLTAKQKTMLAAVRKDKNEALKIAAVKAKELENKAFSGNQAAPSAS